MPANQDHIIDALGPHIGALQVNSYVVFQSLLADRSRDEMRGESLLCLIVFLAPVLSGKYTLRQYIT